MIGGGCEIRTHGGFDPITGFQDQLHKPLGQTSVYGIRKGRKAARNIRKSRLSFENRHFLGPSDWIRTSGLLNPIQARYQTSPHPDLLASLDCLDILAHLAEKCKHFFQKKSNILLRNEKFRYRHKSGRFLPDQVSFVGFSGKDKSPSESAPGCGYYLRPAARAEHPPPALSRAPPVL